MKKYSICQIIIKEKYYTDDGIATLIICGKDEKSAHLYQEICLENFPSFRDFTGYKTIVNEGDTCLILRKIGRPFKINDHPKNSIYDVFQVLYKNKVFSIFRQNLVEII